MAICPRAFLQAQQPDLVARMHEAAFQGCLQGQALLLARGLYMSCGPRCPLCAVPCPLKYEV